MELGKENRDRYEDIIRKAEINGIIDKNERKLIKKITNHYNDLKHKTYYTIDRDLVPILIKEFSNIFIHDN